MEHDKPADAPPGWQECLRQERKYGLRMHEGSRGFTMAVLIGLDIGGTKIMVASADRAGNILRRARSSTSTSLETDLENINNMISEVAIGEQILSMGAAIGGPLDWEQGIVSPLHQPAWRDVPLKAMMEAKWDCPFHVDVDTNVAAIGE